ncbi:hypothetical protein [Bifidobacterium parmae]|uniref:Uncharacterized protein n=1 Tax=Bifidobacterium parmae TaxID=361854 RepID=A0A2N5J4X7_9BIFI|nr:hypothetical protein [Bifidobacterium parmae]PLS29258.1 hypothetical protein Uis4E_0678 [Bifidobacterium parmae]
MVFFRYVALGTTADGDRVFWDTREDVGVKLAANHWERPRAREARRAHAGVKPGTRHGAASSPSYGPERNVGLLLGMGALLWFAALLALFVINASMGDAYRYRRHGRGAMLGAAIDAAGQAGPALRIAMIAAAVALGLMLCWICHGALYGDSRDYEPATPREVAFATAQDGPRRYRLGCWFLFPLRLVMLWSAPANLLRPLLDMTSWWAGSAASWVLGWSLMAWLVYPLLSVIWLAACDRRAETRDLERGASPEDTDGAQTA